MAFMRPCISCGKLTRGSNRCEEHKRPQYRTDEQIAERNAKKKVLYSSAYRKAAKQVRDNAVVCHICGKGANPHDPWQADHLIPGDPMSPLAPAHRSCNASRGDKKII
jgi:hypothetical protein